MVDEMFRSHHHLARRDTFATAVTVALVLLLLLLLAMLLVVLLVLLMHGRHTENPMKYREAKHINFVWKAASIRPSGLVGCVMQK